MFVFQGVHIGKPLKKQTPVRRPKKAGKSEFLRVGLLPNLQQRAGEPGSFPRRSTHAKDGSGWYVRLKANRTQWKELVVLHFTKQWNSSSECVTHSSSKWNALETF